MKTNKLLLGCIADDFTGAGDIASFLTRGGLRTILISGIPADGDIPKDADAVVISLKSRTAPVREAVRDTLESIRSLKTSGCERFYIKYCSTFDSTPHGNIGPVLDAVLEYLNETCTVLCPSLPVNGRTVKDGILYVDKIPLSKSSMKDHPLTPMWDSRIAVLMSGQSRYPCLELGRKYYSHTSEEAYDYIKSAAKGHSHYYIIPDYENEEDAAHIIRLFSDMRVMSGGSGLAAVLAGGLSAQRKDVHVRQMDIRAEGASLIVAGSISKATTGQIHFYKEQGLPYYKISPEQLWKRTETASSIWNEIKHRLTGENDSVLVYCSDSREDVKKGQELGGQKFAGLLEDTLAKLAAKAAEEGIYKIIAAGGETSGAVTKKLGYKAFYTAQSVAPGVPVLIPADSADRRLILKSGNFGQEDFFIRALEVTRA